MKLTDLTDMSQTFDEWYDEQMKAIDTERLLKSVRYWTYEVAMEAYKRGYIIGAHDTLNTMKEGFNDFTDKLKTEEQ